MLKKEKTLVKLLEEDRLKRQQNFDIFLNTYNPYIEMTDLSAFKIPMENIFKIKVSDLFKIERVIFNKRATIVFWTDKTKTVVKCNKDDNFSKEAGIALCFMKKVLGNKGNYNNVFRKHIKEEE